MAISITNLPQKILQILIYIILSSLVWIYAPITITAICKLTILTDRWHFCEPNKLGFTIFGHLQNLLQFIKVQLKN